MYGVRIDVDYLGVYRDCRPPEGIGKMHPHDSHIIRYLLSKGDCFGDSMCLGTLCGCRGYDKLSGVECRGWQNRKVP